MESGGGVSPVLLVVPRLTLGGTERQIALLAGGLRRRGVDARVLVLFSGGAREHDLRAQEVPYVVLGLPDSVGKLWRLPSRLIRLYRLLRQVRPAVVHAFLFEAYVLVPPVARLAGVPVVVAGRRALSAYKGNRRWAFWLERVSNRFVDLFVANASAVARDTADVERVPPMKIVSIPNAITSPTASETSVRIDLGPGSVVVCVANLFRYKGHHVLLDAVAELAATGDECSVTLVGDGPCRDVLEADVRRRRLAVTFVGQQQDVTPYIQAADVVVLPSLHEGMSNVVMEAMALGRPVVATDVGGIRELLANTGVLCQPNDAHALAESLRRLLRDAPLRSRLGEAGRDRVRREFTVDAMVERHLMAYTGLLDARCGAAG